MLRTHRIPLLLAGLAALVWFVLFASLGVAKPAAQWKLLDIASESSIALMAFAWLLVVLSSRPAGRTTALLAGGLAGLMLGAWADVLDEFFVIAKGLYWNHVLESGTTLMGMAVLSCGLLYWRREQLMVTDHLQKRERLFRDHRAFDPLTQLADADYLREQLRIEYERGAPDCSLLMLDIDNFHLINRDYGQREGDRLLQAVTHMLLLNLRSSDLLCRYAGDRFAVLVPHTDADAARALADHLRRAVASLRHHAQRSGQPIQVSVRYAARSVDADPRQLLKELNRALERRMSSLAPADERSAHAARQA
ncbi:diguanylate cyclase domain-containing protein [Massilia sp. CF038]|uniref:diguanylate cyclase domain-containing protein n=1 Tax=Massilia sp. CF038 TaxID=1881045 RepID=UPI0009195FC4|nr:diguanylate cyclase [Massilia sp. CF038]SHH13278.1 diguanylate cyclase (GGDEF) domain-containing protein [Massilia sp. CF038]